MKDKELRKDEITGLTYVVREKSENETQTTTVIDKNKCSVFLQTAKAIVVNNQNDCRENVRVLFDNGSQKSFLTEEVSKSLKLRPVRKERLIVNGFGGKEEKLVDLNVVSVSVHNALDEEKHGVIELYVVPSICKPICDQQIELAQVTYEHLISLKLADSSDGQSKLKIDMLIGNDFMWDYVGGDIIRGEDGRGPVAVGTTLGWVLSGSMMGMEKSHTNLVSAHVMRAEIEIHNEEQKF